MALQPLSGGIPIFANVGLEGFTLTPTTNTTIDAAGESLGMIGELVWSDGGSHTVSSAGGKIYYRTGTVTFANAGTTFRIGLQDVDTATGLEDGTYDVHVELTGGGGGIPNSTLGTATMGSGTKTIASGALIAVVFEMTARGGADSVLIARANLAFGFPYCTIDSGSGPAISNSAPLILVEADDGTVGTFAGLATFIPVLTETTIFNSASTPDEYALIFQVPFRCTITRLLLFLGELDAGETGNAHVYSDPTGTPVAERTVAVDPDLHAVPGSGAALTVVDITPFTMEPTTTYALAYTATSTGNRMIRRATTVGTAAARAFTPFGTTMQGGSRSDGTGAFTPSATDWPVMGAIISQLEDGEGEGGGGDTFILLGLRMSGGMN